MIGLEDVWRMREEEVYPALFGGLSRGIFTLSHEIFAAFGVTDPDPRWLTHGVLEFAPNEERDSWLYVTSGYSNPWETEPSEYSPTGDSGAGVEFVMETDRQADWAVVHLRRLLALEILMATGRVGSSRLGLHDRVPLKAPIDGVVGHIVTNVIVIEARWADAKLPSGAFMFVQFAGITDAERDFAKMDGTQALLEKLVTTRHPVVVSDRSSTV